jgi:two-component system response regulator YesN
MNILVADDEPLERELLSDALYKAGFNEIREASNGEEVIRMAETRDYDLILMDIRMPKMDGLAASKEIKAKFPNIEIIIISAYGDFQYAREAIRIGASDYLLKPFDLDHLVEKVENTRQRIMERNREEKKIKALRSAIIESIPFLNGGVLKKLVMERVLERGELLVESPGHPLIEKCKQLVAQCYAQPITLTQIAAMLHVHPSYLSRLFKKTEKMNFIDYLIQSRLNQAKLLLVETKCSIDQIAFDTGFGNQHYFSSLFRKKEGLSPTEYRNGKLGEG